MAEKPYPTPSCLTEQLLNLCWRLAVEMRAVYATCAQKISKDVADASYLPIQGKAVSATAADSATKATQDANGRVISDTYATKNSLPVVMTGATASVAGSTGLVPAPAKGDQAKYLKGDGSWGTIAAKTSELTNDAGFITASSLPTKTSQLTNDSDFITSSDISGKLNTSDLETALSELITEYGGTVPSD